MTQREHNQPQVTVSTLSSIIVSLIVLGLIVCWVAGLYSHHSLAGLMVACSGFILINGWLLVLIRRLLRPPIQHWQRALVVASGVLLITIITLPSLFAMVMLINGYFSTFTE